MGEIAGVGDMFEETLKIEFITALFRARKMSASFPAGCGFQIAEMSVMQRVVEGCPPRGQCLNVAEIQETLHISKSAVSQTLSSLEKKGCLVRQIDLQDRRKIVITATPKGQQELDKATRAYGQMMDELMRRYGQENMQILIEKLNLLAEIYEELKEGQALE